MNKNIMNDTTNNGTGEGKETTNQYLIKFSKPYEFEGQTYTEIDLSGIEDISTKDLVDVDKLFYQTGNLAPQTEMTLAYACIVASKVAKKPLEFFNGLSGKEGIKVKTAVTSFLYN